jgi:hypothetical protein
MTPADMSRMLWEGRRPTRDLTCESVPAHRGLYVWYSIRGDAVLFVGKATGDGGLRQRGKERGKERGRFLFQTNGIRKGGKWL